MNISINWLKQYIDLEGISTEEIEDKLTTCGLEVEEIFDKKKDFENIVVGYVEERIKHPDADKLSLCKVNDGNKIFNVVCGAPNVDAGQKIAFARVGAIIPNGNFKITKAKIRGQVSMGMICSGKELGINDDHDGIMVLDKNLELGENLAVALGFDDVSMDIAITPNRADALSHWGIARDLAAIYGKETKFPNIEFEEDSKPTSEFASIEIKDKEKCPRYVGKVVTDIEIKESPEWLKKRLIAVGSRPINNVVDVTNYVLYELGQPLHAFDLDELANNRIIVKTAGDDKKFTTLDSKERELQSDDLMICDGEKPVAIAGVMGGENSEVTSKTKNILIEGAFFDPSSIRKTAKLLGLSTDASYRFERGCNPDMALIAVRRAAQLISELAGGKISKGEIDVYPETLNPKMVELRFSRIERVLGYEIDLEKVVEILNRLDLKVDKVQNEKIFVSVPYFRHDIDREIDLIEEVARIYGYDKIPPVDRIANNLEAKVDKSALNKKVKDVMTGLGFYEILTNSLLNEETALKFGNAIKVLNPQNVGMSHTRPSLIPGALSIISKNAKVKENSLLLFETGHVFEQIGDGEISSFEDISETEHLLFAVAGQKYATEWYNSEKVNYDFYDTKGYLDEFLNKMSFNTILRDNYKKFDQKVFEYGYYKTFKKKNIASIGKIKNEMLQEYNIDFDVFVVDVNLSELEKIHSRKKTFKELLKYPKMLRDFAFIFDKSVTFAEVNNLINNSGCKLLKNSNLFDIFESDSLGVGKKSMAFQLEFYDYSRTLTDEEVDKEFWHLIDKIKKTFNAELRG